MYGLRLFIVVLYCLPNCLHACMIRVRGDGHYSDWDYAWMCSLTPYTYIHLASQLIYMCDRFEWLSAHISNHGCNFAVAHHLKTITVIFYESTAKMSIAMLLLSLLWSLVEVHSQTGYLYVSFRGETLPNHSYVDLSLVGDPETGGDSVQCVTNLATCCSGALINTIVETGFFLMDGNYNSLGMRMLTFIRFVKLRELSCDVEAMLSRHLVSIAVRGQLMLSMVLYHQ